MTEKTRQLAVFKAKQDERKQRKIEFKSTRLKTVSDKLKELNALMQAGQKCWNNQKQVLSDIDKSQQELQFKKEESEIEHTSRAKIDEIKASNGGADQMSAAMEHQRDLLSELSARKERSILSTQRQENLSMLSKLEDVIDTHEEQLTVQIANEDALINTLVRLEEDCSAAKVEIEMEMSVA